MAKLLLAYGADHYLPGQDLRTARDMPPRMLAGDYGTKPLYRLLFDCGKVRTANSRIHNDLTSALLRTQAVLLCNSHS